MLYNLIYLFKSYIDTLITLNYILIKIILAAIKVIAIKNAFTI